MDVHSQKVFDRWTKTISDITEQTKVIQKKEVIRNNIVNDYDSEKRKLENLITQEKTIHGELVNALKNEFSKEGN